ncbi:IclR family transcriptional regulator [Alloalcanivorax mobilis]|uniref:IclR family transcriptional regulator n=1 Tax=Alloalcanivorax mobilis TaxID=2019569 RepID=UPI000B5B21CC|nr:IclR family transcriptional regulator [Alloalcanivorax mobilis]ASK34983.1 IclR family transcriptional regulator [Alcanivorax sp. N3-2A]
MATPVNASVIKAFRILGAFTFAGEKLTLSQLSQRLDINIATAHRFLTTLLSVGAIGRTPDGAFELGLLLADLGGRVSVTDAMHRLTQPHVESLALRFGETIHVGIPDNGMVCYVAKGEGSRSLTIITHIGKRLPAYCTGLGKALLSRLEGETLNQFLERQDFRRFTQHTLIDAPSLIKELSRTRKRGYALDNEEVETGLRCVAVPISDHSGTVRAAISLSAPITRLNQAKIREVAAALREHAAQIGASLPGAF